MHDAGLLFLGFTSGVMSSVGAAWGVGRYLLRHPEQIINRMMK